MNTELRNLRGLANRRGSTMSVAAARDRFAAGNLADSREHVRTRPVALPGYRGGRGRGDSVAAARSRFQNAGGVASEAPLRPPRVPATASIAARVPSERRPQEKSVAERAAPQVIVPKLISFKLDEISKQAPGTLTEKGPRKMGSWYYTQLKELQEANAELAKQNSRMLSEQSTRVDVAIGNLELKWLTRMRTMLKILLDADADDLFQKGKVTSTLEFMDAGDFAMERVHDMRTRLYSKAMDQSCVTQSKEGMRKKLLGVFKGISTLDASGNRSVVNMEHGTLPADFFDQFLSEEVNFTLKEDSDFKTGNVAMATSYFSQMKRAREQFDNRSPGGPYNERRRMQLLGNMTVGSVAQLANGSNFGGMTNGMFGNDTEGLGLHSISNLDNLNAEDGSQYANNMGIRFDAANMTIEEKEMLLLDDDGNLDVMKLQELHAASRASITNLREVVSSLTAHGASKNCIEAFDIWAADQPELSHTKFSDDADVNTATVAAPTLSPTDKLLSIGETVDTEATTAALPFPAALGDAQDIMSAIIDTQIDLKSKTHEIRKKSDWLQTESIDHLFSLSEVLLPPDLKNEALIDAIGDDILGIKPLKLKASNRRDPHNFRAKQLLHRKWAWKKILELQRLKLLIRGCVALKCRFTGWIVPVDSFFLHLCESSEAVDMEGLFDGTLQKQEIDAENFTSEELSDVFIPKDLLECVEEDYLLSQQIQLRITTLVSDSKGVGNSYKYVIELHVGRIIWTIYRRYLDFVSLHRELVAIFPRSDFPWEVIPKWSLFAPSKNELLLKLHGLEYYLQSILSVKYMRDDPMIRSFLHLEIGLS